MLYPPRVTVTPLDSLLALNLAIARASAYVAPPTMKTMISAGFFEMEACSAGRSYMEACSASLEDGSMSAESFSVGLQDESIFGRPGRYGSVFGEPKGWKHFGGKRSR